MLDGRAEGREEGILSGKMAQTFGGTTDSASARSRSTPPSPSRSNSYNAAATRCFASDHAKLPATNETTAVVSGFSKGAFGS